MNKLAGSQDGAALRAAVRAAVAPITRKFEHQARVRQLIDSERFWEFGNATDAERKAALKDLTAALQALPVGTSKEDMEEVKSEALEPHRKAVRRRMREAQREAEAREVAEKGLRHLKHYLFVDFDWDSHEERMETEEELKEQLRPHLEQLAEPARSARPTWMITSRPGRMISWKMRPMIRIKRIKWEPTAVLF